MIHGRKGEKVHKPVVTIPYPFFWRGGPYHPQRQTITEESKKERKHAPITPNASKSTMPNIEHHAKYSPRQKNNNMKVVSVYFALQRLDATTLVLLHYTLATAAAAASRVSICCFRSATTWSRVETLSVSALIFSSNV